MSVSAALWDKLTKTNTGTALEDARSPHEFWLQHRMMVDEKVLEIDAYFKMLQASDEARPLLLRLLRQLRLDQQSAVSATPERAASNVTATRTTTPASSVERSKRGRDAVADDADDYADDNDSMLDVAFGDGGTSQISQSAKKTVTAAATAKAPPREMFVDDGTYIRLTAVGEQHVRGSEKPENIFVNAVNGSSLFTTDVNGAAAIALRMVGVASLQASSDKFDLLRLRITGTMTRSFELFNAGETGTSNIFKLKTLVSVVNDRYSAMKRATEQQLPRSFASAPVSADVQRVVAFLVEKGDIKLVAEPARAARRLVVRAGREAAVKAVLGSVAQAAFDKLPANTQWKGCASRLARKATPVLNVHDFNVPPPADESLVKALLTDNSLPEVAKMPLIVTDGESGDRVLSATEDAQCALGDAMIGLALIAPLIDVALVTAPFWSRVLLSELAVTKSPLMCMAGAVVDEAVLKQYVNTDANEHYLSKYHKRKLHASSSTTPTTNTATTSTALTSTAEVELSTKKSRRSGSDNDDSGHRLTEQQKLKIRIDRHAAAAMLLVKVSGCDGLVELADAHAVGDCSFHCATAAAAQLLTTATFAKAYGFKSFTALEKSTPDHVDLAKRTRAVYAELLTGAFGEPGVAVVHQKIREYLGEYDKDEPEFARVRQQGVYVETSLALRLAAAVVDAAIDGSGRTTTYTIGVDVDRWPSLSRMLVLLQQSTLNKDELINELQPSAFWCQKDGAVHGQARDGEDNTIDVLGNTLNELIEPALKAVARNDRAMVSITGVRYQHTWALLNSKNTNAKFNKIVMRELPPLGKF